VRAATSTPPAEPAAGAARALFDPRASALSLLTVLLGAANLLLLHRLWGSGATAASFLLAGSIVSLLQLLFAMACEQFVFHYHRAHAERPGAGESLYAAALVTLGAGGAVAALAVHAAAPDLVAVFAAGLGDTDARSTGSLLALLALSLASFLPLQLVQSHLAAHGAIARSCGVAIVPVAAQAVALCAGLLRPVPIEAIAWALVGGHFAGLALGLAWSPPRRTHLAEWPWRRLRAMVADSARTRAAHNVHNVMLLVIANDFASHLPSALAALFFYARRAADTCLAIVYGPTHRILVNRIAIALGHGATGQVLAWTRRTDLLLPPLFAALAAIGVAAAPALAGLDAIDADGIVFVQVTFALLMLQSLLVALELPFAIVNLAQGRAGVFWLSNALFVAVLAALVAALGGPQWPPALALSIAAAQAVNFVLIRRCAIGALRPVAVGSAA
jgi:hypothetical protein